MTGVVKKRFWVAVFEEDDPQVVVAIENGWTTSYRRLYPSRIAAEEANIELKEDGPFTWHQLLMTEIEMCYYLLDYHCNTEANAKEMWNKGDEE